MLVLRAQQYSINRVIYIFILIYGVLSIYYHMYVVFHRIPCHPITLCYILYLAEVRHFLLILRVLVQLLDLVHVRREDAVLVVDAAPHGQELGVPVLHHVHVTVRLHAELLLPQHVRLSTEKNRKSTGVIRYDIITIQKKRIHYLYDMIRTEQGGIRRRGIHCLTPAAAAAGGGVGVR